jgi:ferredoxin
MSRVLGVDVQELPHEVCGVHNFCLATDDFFTLLDEDTVVVAGVASGNESLAHARFSFLASWI